MQSQSVVYLESVSKIYPSAKGEVYAVRDVTIDVQPGEFYSLLGSSGSGKTTTLRMIGGFEIPEYGQVYIGGEAVTTLPPYRRNVHTVFQNYALFPHMTVAENIAYPLTIAKVPRSEIEPQVKESLRMFQIQDFGDRKPSQLSGGQQQRVALARALISRPKVLLLDEPLSALDAKIREEVRQELRELQRQLNLTFIYVTHDQEEALALSDRIAVMHKGKVEQIGTPKEIYNRPASLFVSQFIGKANFLTGTVQQVIDGRAIVSVNNQPIKAVLSDRIPIQPNQTVTLMIRPERIRLNQNTIADNQVKGTIESITYIGQSLQIHAKTDLGMLVVTELYDGGDRSDQNLTLFWNAEDCIVIETKE
ncbi:ABC transporter ATP-binding protein [Leptolyngbya ohadii]|uniref:ABC transporter ATP-binding protein n=1 Tax=Leptolyngbya ohadii TaxID=1962290 RepID=UPI000B59CA35|nr:ABC transporter ATP-binding protein [Leptolyngbya ohadii]